MGIIIGSARHDERNKLKNGKKGDQLQATPFEKNDYKGEVSLQEFYVHSKGWYILRPIADDFAYRLANAMHIACNNKCIGYGQECQRKSIDNLETKVNINVDCSKLVRDCVYYASKVDVGNFSTANEVSTLERSGLFQKRKAFVSLSKTPIYNGDVLVTKTKGHTIIVVAGSPRDSKTVKKYYPKYTGKSNSIVTALKAVGEENTSFTYRKKIATTNGIANYQGTYNQNISLVKLLKQGKLVRV